MVGRTGSRRPWEEETSEDDLGGWQGVWTCIDSEEPTSPCPAQTSPLSFYPFIYIVLIFPLGCLIVITKFIFPRMNPGLRVSHQQRC